MAEFASDGARLSAIAESAIRRSLRRHASDFHAVKRLQAIEDEIVEDVRAEVAGSWIDLGHDLPQVDSYRDPTRRHLITMLQRVFTKGPVVLPKGAQDLYLTAVMAAIDGIYGEPPEGSELPDPQVEIERLTRLLRTIKGMCVAGEWIDGDSLGRYIDYRLLGVPEVIREAKA